MLRLLWSHAVILVLPKLARKFYCHPRLRRLLRKLGRPFPKIPLPAMQALSGPLKGKLLMVSMPVLAHYVGTQDHEDHVLQALRSHIKTGDTVLDVGAHAGYVAMILADLVGSAGRVVCFEPDRCNFQQLQAHIRLNNLRQVMLRNVAVSDAPGHAQFAARGDVVSRLSDGLGPAGAALEESDELVDVECVTLDGETAQGEALRPNLVKIDVEGHEGRVLLGARRILTESKPVLLVEIHHKQAFHDCYKLLVELGFDLKPLNQAEQFQCQAAAVSNGTDAAELTTPIHVLCVPRTIEPH